MLTEEKAIELLRKHAPDEQSFQAVLAHSQAVQRLALELQQKIGHGDASFIRIAALLHDIGRFYYPPGLPNKEIIKHGIKGGEILRQLGYERYARVCERHIGVGITIQDIEKQDLPLPKMDYVPESIEEKIICYADKRMAGARKIDIDETIERFTKDLGPEYGERVKKLHGEIMFLIKNREEELEEQRQKEEKEARKKRRRKRK